MLTVPVGYRHFKAEIDKAATEAGIDPLIVAAVCWQESGFNTDAFRNEPAFYNRYIKPKGLFPGQNPRRISSSYGLAQIMFPVAVELGFKGSPEDLFKPEIGLYWSCKRLQALISWAATFTATADDRLASALAAYNGGKADNQPGRKPLRNGVYASSVIAKLLVLRSNSV